MTEERLKRSGMLGDDTHPTADMDSLIIHERLCEQAKTLLNLECGGHAGGTLERARRIERASKRATFKRRLLREKERRKPHI